MEATTSGTLSLTHIARLRCINNAHLINDIGSTPYHLIEPVLVKKTAKSLKQIEEQSPHIISDSEKLWKSLISRDFPDRPLTHSVSENGRRVNLKSRALYDKYITERDLQRKTAVGNFKQITKSLNDQKNRNKVKSIENFTPPSRSRISSIPKQQPFKSSLLQKARVANKQRVRNFAQPKTVFRQPAPTNLIRLGKSTTPITPVKRKFEAPSTKSKPTPAKLVSQINYKRPRL